MVAPKEQQALINTFVEIWRIVHAPTPRKTPASEHYARDFDRIRALLKPFVSKQDQLENLK
jgi:hypothetical protein